MFFVGAGDYGYRRFGGFKGDVAFVNEFICVKNVFLRDFGVIVANLRFFYSF